MVIPGQPPWRLNPESRYCLALHHFEIPGSMLRIAPE
jgi:hypothetical protein